jgi:hypothetical protein
VHHVVAEQHGEGVVADVATGHPDRVAETQCLALADRVQLDQVGERPDLGEQIVLATRLEHRLELLRSVEVVLDRLLVRADHGEHVVDAGGDRLLDDVLDGGAIDQGQHLLGHRLGEGEEPGAPSRRGDDGLADGGHGIAPEIRGWVPGGRVRVGRASSPAPRP